MQIITKDISKFNVSNFKLNGIDFEYKRENHTRGVFDEKSLHLVNHWTGGNPRQLFDKYHNNLTEVNGIVYGFRTLKRLEKSEALWQRNTGSINNTMCLLANSKKTMPSENLLIALAMLNAEQCAWYKLDPEGNIVLPKKKLLDPNTLITVNGSISAPIIADHKFFSDKDYPAGRVDIGLERILFVRKKAIEFFNDLKSGKRQFQFLDLIK